MSDTAPDSESQNTTGRSASRPVDRPAEASFPVVAIGASAGGLEALEQFFTPVPADCGYAFVVVQHLDPTQPGMLVELLQRCTSLTVVQISDGMRLQPNHIHVIPPGADLYVLHDVLHVMEPRQARGLRLPIDLFFRSLATDRGPGSIAVVLSGMGSDGTLGLRAIKEQAGAAFVQSPESAKFDSMPRSAIAEELADVIAPPDQLFAQITEYLTHLPSVVNKDQRAISESERIALDKVILLLRSQTGQDFSQYKLSTLSRRIQRRMGLHHLKGIGDYVRYVRENPSEGELLFRELLIGVTSFFRDPDVWSELRTVVLPELLAGKTADETVRAWVTACSTGEEAYSLAIAFHEAMSADGGAKGRSVQLFATDLDPDAIAKARAGVYPLNIEADVPGELLERYFVKTDRGYRVIKEVREMVVFAAQNLVMDPPFTRLDFISCRNLLIYLTPELQKKVIPLFHYSLRKQGVLLLGSAETVGSASELFAPISDKARLYRRIEPSDGGTTLPMPAVFGRSASPPAATASRDSGRPTESLQSSTDRLLLAQYAPAAVLVGDQGDILYVSGRTGRYLEPAAGKANWNVFAMARPGLERPLSEGFWRALRSSQHVTIPDVIIRDGDATLHVRVVIQPITDASSGKHTVLVVFYDLPTPTTSGHRGRTARAAKGQALRDELVQDLEQARVSLLTAREEMQVSQEELRSTNEELQSTNEELQSTNEELTTSKEELQSMNEELQTVNQELQSKLEELSLASTDMANLLNSTSIATLFLDRELKVRRFTTPMESIIHLIPGDVGRPITDIVSTLDFPDMAESARRVMRTLLIVEKEVTASDGRWFAIRILPYRSHDDRIDGVVITLTDITKAKTLEAALRKAQSSLEGQLADHEAIADQKASQEHKT